MFDVQRFFSFHPFRPFRPSTFNPQPSTIPPPSPLKKSEKSEKSVKKREIRAFHDAPLPMNLPPMGLERGQPCPRERIVRGTRGQGRPRSRPCVVTPQVQGFKARKFPSAKSLLQPPRLPRLPQFPGPFIAFGIGSELAHSCLLGVVASLHICLTGHDYTAQGGHRLSGSK
jgi:hypothetical protein